MSSDVPRIILTGTASGVGKTSVTCAIIHGLKSKGLAVQPFKVGPDYIDPGHLSAVSGNPAYNLDVWLMGAAGTSQEFVRRSGSDVSVIEGVMGYYDGFSGKDGHASTRHVAAITRSNAILVVDAAGAARSVAATALGFARFCKNSRVAGIILNRVGSDRHEGLCKDALAGIGIPVVGAIPKDPALVLESRHLGLVPAAEEKERGSTRRIRRIAARMSRYVDIDQILRIASAPKGGMLTPTGGRKNTPSPRKKRNGKKPRCTIAVARDSSFSFYYPANLEALQNAGARLAFFSPVRDKALPECDGIYIGGGFPEVLAGPLAANSHMKKAVKKAAGGGGTPLYAECGGLMYLTRSIHDGTRKHRMVGLVDADTVMTKKPTLGYTKAQIVAGCAISPGGVGVHGHEFHYSELRNVSQDARFAYEMEIGRGISDGRDGVIQDGTLASYGHLFFGGRGRFASTFVANCAAFARR